MFWLEKSLLGAIYCTVGLQHHCTSTPKYHWHPSPYMAVTLDAKCDLENSITHS